MNGVVDFVPDTKLDSDAEYSCRRGFKLVGNDVRHCQANGDWSGSQPTCESKEMSIFLIFPFRVIYHLFCFTDRNPVPKP